MSKRKPQQTFSHAVRIDYVGLVGLPRRFKPDDILGEPVANDPKDVDEQVLRAIKRGLDHDLAHGFMR